MYGIWKKVTRFSVKLFVRVFILSTLQIIYLDFYTFNKSETP